MSRRSYGTGSLLTRRDVRGRERWIGKWWAGPKQVQRTIGLKRPSGSREGLTRAQAERELRRLIDAEALVISSGARSSVPEAGERYLEHLRGLGRKRSTLEDYESTLRVHLAPFFGTKPLQRIAPEDIEGFMAAKASEGRAPKSVLNYLGLLHSIFAFGQKRRWCEHNPCKLVDKPRPDTGDAEIRFLDQGELEALLQGVPDGDLASTDRTLYLTAAMTGLRQAELRALRWRDIDWLAGRVRVRRTYVREEYGTPKSKRSSRSVPLADRVARELERHHGRSAYGADEDLVFGHPHTGKPLERSRLLKRYKAALRAAGVREVRFHDLRHTFGTRMAAAGVPLRTLQEWMGHRDFKTTLIYADYQPSPAEAELVERAFAVEALDPGAGLRSVDS